MTAELRDARPPMSTDVSESRGIPAEVLDEAVVRHVLWQYGLAGAQEPGHFSTALMAAFQRADVENFARLRSVYPVVGFWMFALRFAPEGHELALRALRLMGATP